MNSKINIMLGVTAASIITATSIGYAAEQGVVTTNELNVRSGPGVSYSVLTKVNKESGVTITDNKDGWYKVTLSNGIEGWASASYIDVMGKVKTSYQEGEIINESVYLRDSASWSGKKGEILKIGTKIKILANEGSWVKVQYNNSVGYILSDYIKITTVSNGGNNVGESNTSQEGEIINESVYLRDSASWSGKKGEILKIGTKVKILANEGSWVKVQYNNSIGYIPDNYIKITTITSGDSNVGGSNTSQEGEIINESVYLRDSASWSGKKGEILKIGTKVKILANEGSWVKVQYNNSVGYIPNNYIKITTIPSGDSNVGESNTSQEGEIINESVYLRESASWSGKKGEILKTGTKVKILASEGSWVKVQYNNSIGYIPNTYIKIIASGESSDREKRVQAVISLAKEQLGKPYVYGAQGPNSFDCSGLLYYVFDKATGIKLPRVSRDQAKVGIGLTLADISPGDIIAFDFNKDGVVTHVGMYIGDGQFIHALKPGTTVQLTSISDTYWKNAISTIRRVL